jgi:hypothetical protein
MMSARQYPPIHMGIWTQRPALPAFRVDQTCSPAFSDVAWPSCLKLFSSLKSFRAPARWRGHPSITRRLAAAGCGYFAHLPNVSVERVMSMELG